MERRGRGRAEDTGAALPGVLGHLYTSLKDGGGPDSKLGGGADGAEVSGEDDSADFAGAQANTT